MADQKKPSISAENAHLAQEGAVHPKLTVTMPLDEEKVAAIKKCIANGELKLTLSHVNLRAGQLGEAWLYD